MTSLGFIDRWFRETLRRKLTRLSQGAIEVRDALGAERFGEAHVTPQAILRVHNARFYRKVVFQGALGFAESLIAGDVTCDDLTSFVRWILRNQKQADRLEQGWALLASVVARWRHALRHNGLRRARQNIQAHYDLGNDFYALWLDETMNYSCGVFESSGASMADASRAKMDRVCRKLALRPGEHVLEIGSGWGAWAIYAAKTYGCHVTTTTISRAQFEFVKERTKAAGLEGRVNVLECDYRQLKGEFDKLVSIEMIEAVGRSYFDTFFRQCGALLKPTGQALLQAIVIADERYEQHVRRTDFIRQFIFPGGCLPSIAALTESAARSAGFRLVHLEDFAPHYAETLRRWRSRFEAQRAEIEKLGFDERFFRMWDYYFAYCEAAFTERQVNVVQMHFAQRHCRVDFTGLGLVEAPESARAAPMRETGRLRAAGAEAFS